MMPGSPAPALVPALAPQGIYVTGDDYLLLTSLASVGSITIDIGGRVLDPKGRPVPFGHRHTPNSDRTAATAVVRLGEGWLQQVSVGIASGTPSYGQAYVRVDLARGDGAGRTTLGTLLAGHVTSTVRQAWPGSLMHGPLERGGALRPVTGTDPAANTEVSETVPTGARWRLVALRVTLVTDVNAANREVSLLVDDGTTTLFAVPSGVNQAASLTRSYSFAAQAVRGAAATSGDIIVPIPDLALLAGYRLQTSTANRQAGDNFGAPQVLVEESLEGA